MDISSQGGKLGVILKGEWKEYCFIRTMKRKKYFILCPLGFCS